MTISLAKIAPTTSSAMIATFRNRSRTLPADGGRVALTVARFVLKHVAFLLLTLLVVSFLVFALNELSPGAAARLTAPITAL